MMKTKTNKMAKRKSMTQKQKKTIKEEIEKLLKRFELEVEDGGRHYLVKFKDRGTGEILNIPVLGESLNFGDIVAFTDGMLPADLTKQNWINLYLETYEKTKEN